MNMTWTDDMPKPLTTIDEARELVQLLNELTARSWPAGSLADNVYLHYHAEGEWKVRVGYGGDWSDSYPTLIDALRAAVEHYRQFDDAGGSSSLPGPAIARA